MEKTGEKRPWKSQERFPLSHSFNNNKLDDRNHFLQNAKASVASLRRLITPTRNADHDQPGTLIIFIGIRTGREFTPKQMEQFQGAMREAINNSKPPAPVKQLKTKPDNLPFAFAIDVALLSPSRDKTVMLYLASPGAEGKCIYPANLALYLRLQNLQEIPSRLAGWNLELEYGPDWVRAVELDSRFGTMYFGDNAKNAGRLDNNVGFDVQLDSRSYVLKPLEVVEGWALFQYSKAHPFFAGGYKLTVWDTLDHKWSGVVSWPDPKQGDNFLGGSLKFTGIDDVSTFHLKYADD